MTSTPPLRLGGTFEDTYQAGAWVFASKLTAIGLTLAASVISTATSLAPEVDFSNDWFANAVRAAAPSRCSTATSSMAPAAPPLATSAPTSLNDPVSEM